MPGCFLDPVSGLWSVWQHLIKSRNANIERILLQRANCSQYSNRKLSICLKYTPFPSARNVLRQEAVLIFKNQRNDFTNFLSTLVPAFHLFIWDTLIELEFLIHQTFWMLGPVSGAGQSFCSLMGDLLNHGDSLPLECGFGHKRFYVAAPGLWLHESWRTTLYIAVSREGTHCTWLSLAEDHTVYSCL